MSRFDLRILTIGILLGALVVGCVPPEDEEFSPISAKAVAPYSPTAQAGLPVTVSADPKALEALVARASRFGRSSDPFRLLPNEIQFERSQTAERLFNQQGPFGLEYEEPIPPTPGAGRVEEPQPYRRLSGIVIGDAIVGILETQGEPAIIIRPGQYIPGTEWRVVLINEDRAILRRAGNRLPREITVNLELPPPGIEPAGGGRSGGAGAGNPNGGPAGRTGAPAGSAPGM